MLKVCEINLNFMRSGVISGFLTRNIVDNQTKLLCMVDENLI